MQISKRWLATLLLVLCGLALRADAASTAGAGASATTPQESTAYVWSGRSRLADGSVHADPLGADFGVRFAKELAEIRVQVDVDRKLEESAERLFDLWIRATRAGYPERQESLVQVLLARSDALAAHGETQAAADALTTVLPATPVAKGYELVPAGEADRALARAVAQDARILQALSSLSATRATPDPSTEGEDKISQIVGAALVRGDLSLSTSLGERAVPMLVARVESSLDEFPPIARDPLYHLTAVDTDRAAELVVTNYAKGGAIWKARVVRLVRNSSLFSDSSTFTSKHPWTNGPSERQAPTYAFPHWFDVLEVLITDPSTRREAIGFVSGLPERDALTPGLRRALATMLSEPASPYADEILAMLRLGRGRPTTQSLLESVLSSRDPKVREFAAGMLSTFETPVGLREAYRHPDPVVRRYVAESLQSRYVATPKYPLNSGNERKEPQIGEKERAILVALARDSDAGVRVQAANGIAELEAPLEKGVYEDLVRDPDARVRVAVLAAQALPIEQRAALAENLAGDSDPNVLAKLDQVLTRWMAGRKEDALPDVFLPVLRARRANSVWGLEDHGAPFGDWYVRLSQSESGLRLLLEWGAAPGGEQPISAFCFSLRDIRNRRSPVSIVADGELWTGAYRAALSLRNSAAYLAIAEYLIDQIHQSVPAFLAVAQDTSLDADGRLGALAIAANSQVPGIEQVCLSIVGSVSAIEAPRVRYLDGPVAVWIVRPLSDATCASLADDLIARDSLPSPLIGPLLEQIFRKRPPSNAQSNAILTRFLGSEASSYDIVTPCLVELARRPRAEQGEWLSRAACIQRYSFVALELIGGLRDPSYVDLLHDLLTGKSRFSESSEPAPNVRSAALNALTRYFDQRAADIILEVAGSTPDAGFRDECFKALETIRHYEAEKGRVDRDRAGQQAVTTAVKDLVAMLGDASAEIRVQALRGLATLDAIEQLPAVVRCLKDGDERVRQAAQAALDALNRPPAQK